MNVWEEGGGMRDTGWVIRDGYHGCSNRSMMRVQGYYARPGSAIQLQLVISSFILKIKWPQAE
jgi:hypothetical protein